MDEKIINSLLEYSKKNENVALVTITKTQGSGPRNNGSMMIVSEEGELLEGTIGGGAIELKALSDAKDAIAKRESKSVYYELTQSKSEHALGMICGGTVEAFIKVFSKNDRLIAVGVGHIGYELTKFASEFDYTVIAIDDREDYANKERLPHVDVCIVGNVAEELKKLNITNKDSIVIVTHGHENDLVAVRAVVESDARYIGMIGSRNKVSTTFNNLKKDGVDEKKISKIYAPIGLNIGGDSPAEIALAIMAEIQAVRYKRNAGFISRGVN